MAKPEENFKKMKDFFEYNMKIKEELVKAGSYIGNEIDYSKKLDNSLRNITLYFRMIFSCLYVSLDEQEYVITFLNNCRDILNNNELSLDQLNEFYKIYFANMDKKLVDKLNRECFGFLLASNSSITDGKSINEMLHIIHHSVVNNENYYESMPVVFQKGEEYLRVTLYGEDNNLSKGLYTLINPNPEFGDADILSLSEDKILIMVRGAGHALTIEIEKQKQGDYMVRYFVPKITNVELVNMLPGVTKKSELFGYTNGKFLVSKEDVLTRISNFIEMVPSDSDNYSYDSVEFLINKKQQIQNLLPRSLNDEIYFNYLNKKLDLIERLILKKQDEMPYSFSA